MQPRTVRVSASAESFTSLFESARSAAVRVGWLDLVSTPELPCDLSSAAESGALRAVSVNDGRVVSIKSLVGQPVLRDVIREHFTGCRLLLVRGQIEAPELVPRPEGWLLRSLDGVETSYSNEKFLSALRSPSFP
jgi:hypothetical protein